MIIQLVLIGAFIFLLGRFLSNPHSSQVRAGKKILGVLFTLAAIIVIAFPDLSNEVAHAVGVGRGADLLIYLVTVGFIFNSVNMYIKEKQDQKKLTMLARKVAILEANIKSNNHP